MVRCAARVLLVDARSRVLLLQGCRPSDGFSFWLLPGGGLLPGEDFAAAALRETREETGLEFELGPCIWLREHSYEWDGRTHRQRERVFLGRARGTELQPSLPDRFVVAHRWWTLAEIERSGEIFAPRELASLLAPILAGVLPDPPIECGS